MENRLNFETISDDEFAKMDGGVRLKWQNIFFQI